MVPEIVPPARITVPVLTLRSTIARVPVVTVRVPYIDTLEDRVIVPV